MNFDSRRIINGLIILGVYAVVFGALGFLCWLFYFRGYGFDLFGGSSLGF